MTAGELACSLSHRHTWQVMLDTDVPAALILEDDVVLSSRTRELLADPELLSGSTDALQLENHRTNALVGRPIPTTVAGVAKHRLMSSSLGGAAYVMTAQFARRVLQLPYADQLPLDSLLFSRSGGAFYQMRLFQILPALAIQLDKTVGAGGVERSDLTPRRLSPSTGAWPERLRRLTANLRHAFRVLRTFGPTGELWGARQIDLPVADDLARLMPPRGLLKP